MGEQVGASIAAKNSREAGGQTCAACECAESGSDRCNRPAAAVSWQQECYGDRRAARRVVAVRKMDVLSIMPPLHIPG